MKSFFPLVTLTLLIPSTLWAQETHSLKVDEIVARESNPSQPATLSPAAGGQKERTPEATSLLGVHLYPPSLSAEAAKRLEENLTRAKDDFIRDPDNADNIIWLGRRLSYLGRYREAIAVYSRGIEKHPADFRLLRHRGHRYITVREFDRAIADLETATRLIRGIADQPEPDGAPSARPGPSSTSHFNIWYHLGLAHYLKGDFESALRNYMECMKFSAGSDESLVATSDWLYMTLRRLNRNQEAARVLEPIYDKMDVLDNRAYLERLLMYKGDLTPEQLLGRGDDSTGLATYGYGIGNWYLYNGEAAKAREVFQRITSGEGWPAFGFVAAEAELARMK